MSKTITTAAAYDAARIAQEAAEQAHADAVQAVEQARTHQTKTGQTVSTPVHPPRPCPAGRHHAGTDRRRPPAHRARLHRAEGPPTA